MSRNLTISLSERLLEAAREVARRRGVSLNALIRQYLEALTREADDEDDPAGELLELLREHGGHSGGWGYRRDDAYEDRLR
jgi:hypothetical protein